MRHHTPFVLTLAALAALSTAGCDGGGADQAEPAQETGSDDVAAATRASVFPDAPSRLVRRSVRNAALEVEEGEATFYADQFDGRRTASGRTFRQSEMVAAHRAFPFGTQLRVTNTANGNEVEVRVVDRGPFGKRGELAPVLDLSRAAAERLDFVEQGRARVRVDVLEWGP